MSIDSGDWIEHHGRRMQVACVHGSMLRTLGHPEITLLVELCTLLEQATSEQRNQVLLALAGSSSRNHRPECARERLASMGLLVDTHD